MFDPHLTQPQEVVKKRILYFGFTLLFFLCSTKQTAWKRHKVLKDVLIRFRWSLAQTYYWWLDQKEEYRWTLCYCITSFYIKWKFFGNWFRTTDHIPTSSGVVTIYLEEICQKIICFCILPGHKKNHSFFTMLLN